MPYINSVKEYIKDGIYHVYNKTIHGITLFRDEDDFIKFLSLLYRYLTEPTKGSTPKHKLFHDKIKLISFCLMDNHIHLLLKQIQDGKVLAKFMKSLIVSYTRYFNDKYGLAGPVLHGVYRARQIENNLDLIQISKYIHLNPSPDKPEKALYYPYSSVRCFTTESEYNFSFVCADEVLRFFDFSPEKYKNFLLL